MGTKKINEEARVTILSLADHLSFKLLQLGYKVQRYNSDTTNSVYIKLDYGVCNSIRISDSTGKKQYKYRFNVDVAANGIREERVGSVTRIFYGIDSLDQLISDITDQKSSKLSRYGQMGYRRLMEINKIQHCTDAKGFWRASYELILDHSGNMIVA